MSSDISITNVRHRPDDPQEGETVEFNVEVENTGYSTIESIDIVIYDESDSPVYVPVNFDLPPGESQWGG